MPITATCPTCHQVCSVEDHYAGAMVQCPHCKNIIVTPRTSEPPAAIPVSAPPPPPAGDLPPPSVPPPPPPRSAGPGLMESVEKSAKELGLDPLQKILFLGGMGSLAVLVLASLLPGTTHRPESGPIWGITTIPGGFSFLLTVAAGSFVAAMFLAIKKPDLFNVSLCVAAGWGVISTLWRFVDVCRFGHIAGIGLYLAFLTSLAVAGTFGVVAVQRLVKKK